MPGMARSMLRKVAQQLTGQQQLLRRLQQLQPQAQASHQTEGLTAPERTVATLIAAAAVGAAVAKTNDVAPVA